MRRFFAIVLAGFICLFCFAAARGEAPSKLTLCEYAILGGMENEHFVMTLDADGLAVSDRDTKAWYATTWDTLRDLQNYIAQYAPESWADLPYAEEYLLDAPSEHLRVEYSDGRAFSISGDQVQPGGLMRDVYRFLKSYTVEDAQTFTLTITTREGIVMQEMPVLAAPEILFVRTVKDYGPSHDPLATGSQYTETYEYHGRIPGTTELTVNGFGTGEPIPVMDPDIGRPKIKVYTLTVDSDYNVSCKESWRWIN
ncbi:MAG: hypothetical protein IJ214_12470 [Clostridia bacterium]|nr:hypothetical protein [Clostridia bacterium]